MGAAWATVAVVVTAMAVGVVWMRRRYLLVHVVGRSMEPTLRNGQRVFARRVRFGRVRSGDVVVLEPPDGGGLQAASSGPGTTPRSSARMRPAVA